MDRRGFMISVGGAAAGIVLLPRLADAAAGRIDWYTASDQNVLDFWTNVVKPKFEAANPGITINLVDAGDNAGLAGDRRPRARGAAEQGRSAGRLSSRTSTRACPPARIDAGLYGRLLQGGPLELLQAQPARPRHPTTTCPTAAAQVLLAYDTDQAQGRRRAEDLGRPRRLDQGQPRPVHLQPSRQGRLGRQLRPPRHLRGQRQRPGEVHGRQLHARSRPRRCSTRPGSSSGPRPVAVRTRAPTPRATPSRSSSCRQSAVTMIPAWSDQALSAIEQGVLPETTGLVQLDRPRRSRAASPQHRVSPTASTRTRRSSSPTSSSATRSSTPVLTELGGFPGVSWDYVAAGAARQVQATSSRPRSRSSPAATGTSAINDGWYRNVAPNVDRSEVTVAAAGGDIVGRHSPRASAGPIGLLLVAAAGPPRRLAGHLADRLGDRPHALAAATPTAATRFSLETYEFFFSDGYSLANLTVTLWTTVVCARPPADRLPADRALPALRDRPARRPMCRASRSSRCSCPRSSSSYAFIRVLGPNGTVDILLNAVAPAEDPLALPDPLGPGDRARLGQHPADRPDPALRARRRLQRSRSRPPATSAPAALARPLAHHPAAPRQLDPRRDVASPCSASSRPSPCPTCSAPPRPR